jgi:hypothetical protein
LRQNVNCLFFWNVNYKLFVVTFRKITLLTNCFTVVFVRQTGAVERVGKFVSPNSIRFTLQVIDFFFLEMSPHTLSVGLFYFYGKVKRRVKVRN